MDVGQALVNERTFDLNVHAGVCVCVCVCVTRSVLCYEKTRWWRGVGGYCTSLPSFCITMSAHELF